MILKYSKVIHQFLQFNFIKTTFISQPIYKLIIQHCGGQVITASYMVKKMGPYFRRQVAIISPLIVESANRFDKIQTTVCDHLPGRNHPLPSLRFDKINNEE